jgi:hypothetical protein
MVNTLTGVEIDGPCHDPESDRQKDELFERVRGI